MAQVKVIQPSRTLIRVIHQLALGAASLPGLQQEIEQSALWHELSWQAGDEVRAKAQADAENPPAPKESAVATEGMNGATTVARRQARTAARKAEEAEQAQGDEGDAEDQEPDDAAEPEAPAKGKK